MSDRLEFAIYLSIWAVFSISIWLLCTLFLSVLQYGWVDPLIMFKEWTKEGTQVGERLGTIISVLVCGFISLGLVCQIEVRELLCPSD